MALFLRADPTLPDHTIQTVLGGVAYLIRYVWKERIGAWFVDVSLVEGGLRLLTGRRLAAMRVTSAGIGDGWGGGLLFCVGRDDAPREALGTDDLCLVWYSPEEMAAQAIVDENAPTVVLG